MKHIQTLQTICSPSLMTKGWESSLYTTSELQQDTVTYRIDILGIVQDIQSFYLSLKARIQEQSLSSDRICNSF